MLTIAWNWNFCVLEWIKSTSQEDKSSQPLLYLALSLSLRYLRRETMETNWPGWKLSEVWEQKQPASLQFKEISPQKEKKKEATTEEQSCSCNKWIWSSYPVPGEHLGPVLVDDLDDAGRLDPRLSVHLHRNPLLPQDGDLHLSALRCSRAGGEKTKTKKQHLSGETCCCCFCCPHMVDLLCPLLLDVSELLSIWTVPVLSVSQWIKLCSLLLLLLLFPFLLCCDILLY